MARRGRKRGEEPSCETFRVLEETEGPHGPETFSVSVAGAALLLPPLPGAPPPPRIDPDPTRPPDPGLVKLVEALARAQARRDHGAEIAERARATRSLGSG